MKQAHWNIYKQKMFQWETASSFSCIDIDMRRDRDASFWQNSNIFWHFYGIFLVKM
jgi:hypothetical protein